MADPHKHIITEAKEKKEERSERKMESKNVMFDIFYGRLLQPVLTGGSTTWKNIKTNTFEDKFTDRQRRICPEKEVSGYKKKRRDDSTKNLL